MVDGLRSVPEPVRQAATAMGFGTTRRLVQVELPLAVPIVIAGLRVAVVSSISLASVGQLIGVSSLGYLFIDGYQRDFPKEIYVGGGLIIALALVCDLLLVLLRRVLTPWRPRRARRQAEPRPDRGAGPAAARRGRMSFFSFAWNWLKQPQQWHGSDGIPIRILEQLGYTRPVAAHRGADRDPARRPDRAHRPGRGPGGQRGQRLAGHPHPRACWSCWPSCSASPC